MAELQHLMVSGQQQHGNGKTFLPKHINTKLDISPTVLQVIDNFFMNIFAALHSAKVI